jgi:hypothetical protein
MTAKVERKINKNKQSKKLIMAIENLISISFTQTELDAMNNAFTAIENTIKGKFINLTPDERRRYAKVGKETEDWIGKVKDYLIQRPELVLKHVDVAEYNKDYESRRILFPFLRRVESIYNLFEDTNMLLGADLYHNAITYYKGLKAGALTNAEGAKTIYADLKQHFPGKPQSVKMVTEDQQN